MQPTILSSVVTELFCTHDARKTLATPPVWVRRLLNSATMPDRVAVEAEGADALRTGLGINEDLEVEAALGRVGRELMAALDKPTFLERLCQLTALELHCDSSHTLLWHADENAYIPAAAFGATPEERALAATVKVPRAMMSELLAKLESGDVAQAGSIPLDLLSRSRQEQLGLTGNLCMALRRGTRLVGLQVALSRERIAPFTAIERRIANGIAQLASVALAHVRIVDGLAKANRLKSDFVATMSHELRTPLQVIIGYTDLVLEGNFGSLTAEQDNCLKRVQERTRELLALISATQELSRLEPARMPLVVHEVLVTELMEQVKAETETSWPAPTQTAFVWNVAADLPELLTDSARLKVVLKNLLSNAVKFTDSGTITVSARRDDRGIEISIADTGIGIAREALPTIFEPFARAQGTEARRAGVGVGLYVARQLLDELGGTMSVDSTLGRGSTFFVRLPITQDDN
jgi:signal transduction histidine kinase